MKAGTQVSKAQESGLAFPVMETFLTIQGEGHHTGTAAWFIRTGGCDVGCHWCDVKESWEAMDHPQTSVEQLISDARKESPGVIVITGGEPLMYNLDVLTMSLRSIGKAVHIETSGAYPLTGEWDWICFSPKKFKKPLEEFYTESDELKIVIYNKSDFAWAESHAAKMNADAHLYLQPEWSQRHKMMPLIVEYVKKHPEWRISLQTHKYLNIP
jgi:organic radical activating enzyme